MFGLVDCNNFFVSCERAVDSSLEGRAVVVLSNNDGCVIARSNEAKQLGIKMGQPAFEIRDLIAHGDVLALSGNHILYRQTSMRIHDIFRLYAPRTIDYSVDESFLDMEGIPDEALEEIGIEIHRRCREQERIPVTVGFAPSKTLAKMATELGKKQFRNVVTLFDSDERKAVMDSLPIRELWGIGRRLAKKLYMEGVYTIGDFADKELIWVRSKFGINGERSWRELHGEPCIELSHLAHRLQESISETRTFAADIGDFDYLRSRIAMFCSHVSRRLRAMEAECEEVSVFLSSNRFHTERGYHSPAAAVRLHAPTNDTAEITTAAIALLQRIHDPRYRYKRAGVILHRISRAMPQAPSLFDDIEHTRKEKEKASRLMKAIDNLNPKSGNRIIRLATELNMPQQDMPHIRLNDGYSSSFGPAKEI